MPNLLKQLTQREALGKFVDAMDAAPNIWQGWCTEVESTNESEQHSWLGAMPKPKEFAGSYAFEGLMDFTYNIANKEFTLAFVIDRNALEDDKTGEIDRRISQAAQFWSLFKDEQLKDKLEATTTDTYDGVAFFSDSRTIGASGTIDNNVGVAATVEANPTTTEFLDALRDAVAALEGFADDQGRAGYNAASASEFRVIVPPKYRKAATEALNATIIVNTSNPFGQNLAQLDVLPYLTAANNVFFMAATGTPQRRPFIMQTRTPFELDVLSDDASLAENHGLKFIARQRYHLQYGEPRKAVKSTFS